MSETFKRGDRVVIQGVLHPIARPHIGRRGIVVAVDSSGAYVVSPDGASPIWVYATEVKSAQDQSDYATGDRVRIVQANYNAGRGRASIGKVGVIRRTGSRSEARGSTPLYSVLADDDGEIYIATAVEKVADPDPSEPALELNMKRMQATAFARHLLGEHARPENLTALADWAFANPEEAAAKIESQRILSGALGPYTVRLQAAKDAVAVIGDGASIEEITALAEWMLSVPKLRAVLGGAPEETEQSFSFGYPNRYVFGGSVGPLVEAPEASKSGTHTDITAAERLANEGTTVRLLEVSLDDSVDSDVVEVNLDGISTYLADDDINELVDYLRAAQVVQAARRAASES